MIRAMCHGCMLAVFWALALCTESAATHNPFHYDYPSLRVGGLIFAGVMLAIGLLVLLTDCNLSGRSKRPSAEGKK
ncbi:sodium/potassium-transporting ATPase subunit gamma-like [Ascaphus truei]|uniref:sodium/potassium-transporting ATPase subunit gamma-like n=1 Tax=Ascaphus truei TaxID=8439 RepID=UPI003F595FAB